VSQFYKATDFLQVDEQTKTDIVHRFHAWKVTGAFLSVTGKPVIDERLLPRKHIKLNTKAKLPTNPHRRGTPTALSSTRTTAIGKTTPTNVLLSLLETSKHKKGGEGAAAVSALSSPKDGATAPPASTALAKSGGASAATPKAGASSTSAAAKGGAASKVGADSKAGSKSKGGSKGGSSAAAKGGNKAGATSAKSGGASSSSKSGAKGAKNGASASAKGGANAKTGTKAGAGAKSGGVGAKSGTSGKSGGGQPPPYTPPPPTPQQPRMEGADLIGAMAGGAAMIPSAWSSLKDPGLNSIRLAHTGSELKNLIIMLTVIGDDHVLYTRPFSYLSTFLTFLTFLTFFFCLSASFFLIFEFTVVVVVGGLDGLCCDLCPTDFIPPAPTYMPEDSGSPLGIDKASWNYDFAPGDAAAFDDEKGGDGAVKPTKFLEEKGKPPITISGLEQRLNDLESLSSKHLEKELTNAKDLKEESQSYISTSSQSKIARKITNSKDATTSTISTSFHSHSKQPENKKLWQQVQQIEKESNRRIPMTSFLETQGFVQDILNNIPLMYKSCCNLCGEDKFAKMDYDDNQYPMLPFLNPHPLFLLELSMRQRLNVLNRKTTKMSNSNKMTNRIGRRKGTSGSGSQLLHHGKAKTKQTISTHGFTSTLSSAASSPSTLSSLSG